MGSQLVKQVFKDQKQDKDAKVLPFNEESVENDFLTDILFEKLFSALNLAQAVEWDTVYPQSNIQTNPKNVDEQFMKKMLKQTVTEDSISGFATSEHTIKLLQESSYSTYFKVHTDKDTIDFTRMQQKKFLVLFGLFQSKTEKLGTSEQNFFQFVENFLQENIKAEDQRSIVGLNTGLRFSLAILKELHKIRSEILVSSLTNLQEALNDAPAGSLYGVDTIGFQQDQTLTEARAFLVSLYLDKDSSLVLAQIAAKIIVRLGIVRSNPEDFLILIEALNKNPDLSARIDLRDEIRSLPKITFNELNTSSNSALQENKSNFGEVVGVLKSSLMFFKSSNQTHNVSLEENTVCSWTSDGLSLYYAGYGETLIKFGVPKQPNETLYIESQSQWYTFDKISAICYLNKRLFVRCSGDQPLKVFDCQTLTEDTQATELIKIPKNDEEISMHTTEKAGQKTGRLLGASPLFTDGNSLYLVSQKKYIKPIDADEDHQSLSTALVIEQFGSSDFKHIRSVTLYKNSQLDYFVNKHLQTDDEYFEKFALKSTWHTNGENLLVCFKDKRYLFNLKTGIRVLKQTSSIYEPIVIHDYLNSRFFMVQSPGDIQFLVDFKLDQSLKTKQTSALVSSDTSHESYLEQLKQTYFNSNPEKKPRNIFQKLMCEASDEVQARTPLPQNARQLVTVLLLDHIKANCEVFDNNFKKIESESKNRQENYLQLFKFKGATYLTSTFFRCLAELLQQLSHLIQAEKSEQTLSEQISYLNLLQILSSNLKALSYCGINLPEIMSTETYQNFLKTYNTNIVQLIEQGYSKNFTGQATPLLEQVWTQIYKICQNIMTDSMQLIFSDTSQIVSNLAEVLSQQHLTEKQAENCSFSLQYLTSAQNITKLLKATELQQRQNLENLLQALSSLKTKRSVGIIQSCSILQTQQREKDQSLFESACDYFQQQFYQQLLTFTETLNQQLQKKVSKNEEAKLKRAEDEELFKFTLKLVSTVYGMLANKLSQEIVIVADHVAETIKQLKSEDVNEEFSKKFLLYSNKIANLTIMPQQIKSLNVYISALPILCAEQVSACSTVTLESIKLVKDVASLTKILSDNANTILGKNNPEDSDEPEPELENNKLNDMLKQLIRRVCWLVGYVSFGLIQVKTVEPTVEESKKETPVQKMERMLMDSKLLSGGLENRFVNSFSQETKQKIAEVLLLSQDDSLKDLLNESNSKLTGQDGIFGEIMTQGKSEICDLLIKLLQYSFERQVPLVNYAKQGGADGLRLTRAAFSVMAMYSQMESKLENMVNEVDMMESQFESEMDENEKLRELRSALKEEPDFQELLKLWNHAGRMRMWIAEKKKNLSEKIEKTCREQYIKELTETKQKQKREQPDIAEAAAATTAPSEVVVEQKEEQVEVQIDTTVLKTDKTETAEVEKPDEKKDEEQKKEEEETEEVKLTAEDKENLQKIIDAQFDKELSSIFDKIIEKAEYLLKMQVPTAYLQLSKEKSLVRMISAPSQIAEEQELVNKLDWRERLKHWKTMRQDQGSIKSDAKLKSEIFDSGSMSVLACLQSPISVKKIQQRVESEFLKASKRVAGLKLIAQLIQLDTGDSVACDLANWFSSALRDKTNKLTHYLSNITGCGNHLESQVRVNFFSIIRSVLEKIKASRSKTHIIRLLDALKWQFWGRDHGALIDLQIFKVLRIGDGDKKHPIRFAWGRAPSNQIVPADEEPSDLSLEILKTFENLYFNLVSRIVDTDLGTSMQLKTTGTAIPALERSKSVISVGQTESLIGSAFDILFKELDRFDLIFKKFKGIDYFTFVRYSNKVKSYTSQSKEIEDLSKKFLEEQVLDVHLDNLEYKEQRQKSKEKTDDAEKTETPQQEIVEQTSELETQKVEVEEQTESKQDSVTVEQQSPPVESFEEPSAFEEEVKSESDVKQALEDSKQAEIEEREKKMTDANDFTKEQTQKMAEFEFQMIQRLYSGAYLTRLLRMIETFTQVAQTQAHPMTMVQRVANPFVLHTLIKLLVCAQPRNQLIVLKIFQSLIHIGIPAEIFEATLQLIAKQEKLKAIIDQPSQIKFESGFIDFWFKMLLEIRSAMWDSAKVRNDDSYEVSQEMGALINSILKESKGQYSDWCDDINNTMTKSFLNIEKLTQAERDVVFCLQIGSDFQRISIGSQVVTASNQLLTVIGYADQDQEAPLVVASNYTSEKQQLLGLYYDDVSKERQEVIRVSPYNLKSVYGLSQPDVNRLANKSVFLQPEVLKHMVGLLISESAKDDLRVQILKSVTSLFTILQKQFLSLLESTELLSPIIKFLLQAQTKEKNSQNTIIPITWLEAKATNIRVAALENDISLNSESNLTAQILNNKQLIITSTDVKQNSKYAQSAYLTSAINIHLLEQGQQYQCNLVLDQSQGQSNIRRGFVFLEGEILKKLDDSILQLMKTSFAIVTHDILVRDLFMEIVAKARASIEADEKNDNNWNQILNCAVLVIAKDDFVDIRTSVGQQVQKSISKVSDLEFLIEQLQVWGGFKTQTILFHISQLEDKSIKNIHNQLGEIIKKTLEEEKQNEDNLKRMKSEKLPIQNEINRIEKVQAIRNAKSVGVLQNDSSLKLNKVKSIVEKLLETSGDKSLENECAVFNILDWKQDNLKDVNKTIQEEFVENKEPVSAQSAKSEEAMCKLYLKELNDFKLTSIASDYLRVIATLLDSYYKNTLLQIMNNCDLSILMQSIVQSDTSSKQLTCYFKSSFNQAWLTLKQTGQKTEIKTVKGLLRKIISFCLSSDKPKLRQFVHKFLQDDVISAGLRTMKELQTVKPKSVADYFAKEETAIEQLHPNFLILIVEIILECRYDKLLESKSYLPAIFGIAMAMFVKFWSSSESKNQMKLLHSCLQVVFFVQEYLDIFVSNGAALKIINTPLLTYIVRQIDFMQETFQEVQKLLLEVYLSVITLKQMAEDKLGMKLDTILEMTLGISQARRALKIVKEKSSFQFLKYYIHETKLQDHDRQLMTQTFGTLNPHFDVKVKAKYSIEEVERIKIKAHDGCELKPYTYLGLSQKPDGEDMKYYTKEELKANDGVIDLNFSHFYAFYPLKKQLLLAMGEQKHYRLTEISVTDVPKVIPQETVPVKVATSKNSTFMQTKDGDLYTTGEKCGSAHSQFAKMPMPKNEVPSKLYCGPRQKFVIAESGKVFFVGESTDFELPNNSTVAALKEFKLSSDEASSETIIDIACGNHYNLFVTNKGRLWASGKQFLKRVGMESETAVPVHLPNEPGLQVQRVWASAIKDQQLALILAKTAIGHLQLYSVGKNEQGLLGQGGKIKETKSFGKIAFDFSKQQLVDVSLYADHAVAIDSEGLLWAWGSNLQQRSGLAEDIDCIFQPTKVAAFEKLNLKALKVSCGLDHTLVLASNNDTGKVQLYSIGKEESNFKTLGTTQQLAGESSIRPIQHFQDFDIVDFSASSKFNMVILGGDNNPDDGLYEHKLSDGNLAKGTLHAYVKDDKWHFMSQKEYDQSEGQDLPDISLAFKCPIQNMDEVFNGPDSIFKFDFEQLLNNDSIESHSSVQSSITEKPIESKVAYFAQTLISGDEIHVNLTSDEFLHQTTQFDVHPLIYFRLKKPLKEGAKLPKIDLQQVYQQTGKFGFKFEVTPNLTFIENKKLIQQTQADYNEYVELSKKFPVEGDSELVVQMSRYLEKQGSFDIVKDDVEKSFKVSELTFKPEGKLHKITETLLKQRVQLYWHFNRSFVLAFPYLLNNPPKGFRGQKIANTSAANLFQEVKSMILTSVKMKFVDNAITNLPEEGRHELTISRNDALRFSETGKVDHTAEHSIFGQILSQLRLSSVKFNCWKQNSIDSQALRVEFDGESSIDAGGPYRETLTNMAVEVESGVLPLMIKSPNNRNNHGDNRDCFVVNQNSKTPTHEEMFKFLGVLIGYAFRSKSCMPYNYAPVFWKQLVGEALTESDLKSFDTYSWQIIQDLRKHAKTIKGQEEFETIVDQQFTTTLNCSQEIELCHDGRSKQVNQSNVEEFISQMIAARFAEGAQQIKWIQEGMAIIVPKTIVNILSWEEVEIRAAGSKTTDVDKLKSITEYRNCTENSKVVKMFWNVMQKMSEEDKTLYLKFVWGRQRLPQDCSGLQYNHRIALVDYMDKEALPESHTCFFAVDIPDYESEEILEKKLLTSIRFCGEIDND